METSVPKLQTFFIAEIYEQNDREKGGAQPLKKKVLLKRGKKGRQDNLFN